MAGIGFRTLEACAFNWEDSEAKIPLFIKQINVTIINTDSSTRSSPFCRHLTFVSRFEENLLALSERRGKFATLYWFRWSFDKPWIDLVCFLLRFEGLKEEEEEGKNINGLCWIHTVARRRWDHHSIISLGSLVDWA